jgi:hypothetical protein
VPTRHAGTSKLDSATKIGIALAQLHPRATRTYRVKSSRARTSKIKWHATPSVQCQLHPQLAQIAPPLLMCSKLAMQAQVRRQLFATEVGLRHYVRRGAAIELSRRLTQSPLAVRPLACGQPFQCAPGIVADTNQRKATPRSARLGRTIAISRDVFSPRNVRPDMVESIAT